MTPPKRFSQNAWRSWRHMIWERWTLFVFFSTRTTLISNIRKNNFEWLTKSFSTNILINTHNIPQLKFSCRKLFNITIFTKLKRKTESSDSIYSKFHKVRGKTGIITIFWQLGEKITWYNRHFSQFSCTKFFSKMWGWNQT